MLSVSNRSVYGKNERKWRLNLHLSIVADKLGNIVAETSFLANISPCFSQGGKTEKKRNKKQNATKIAFGERHLFLILVALNSKPCLFPKSSKQGNIWENHNLMYPHACFVVFSRHKNSLRRVQSFLQLTLSVFGTFFINVFSASPM